MLDFYLVSLMPLLQYQEYSRQLLYIYLFQNCWSSIWYHQYHSYNTRNTRVSSSIYLFQTCWSSIWYHQYHSYNTRNTRVSSSIYTVHKSRGYSNIKNYNIYQTNVINLKQMVLISKVISQPIWITFSRINLVTCFWGNHIYTKGSLSIFTREYHGDGLCNGYAF